MYCCLWGIYFLNNVDDDNIDYDYVKSTDGE